MTSERAPHPYSMLNETDWIPTEADQTMELFKLLVEHFGHRTASGMLGWMQIKLAGLEDPLSPDTRSRFRRNLRHLEELGITPPQPGTGKQTREAAALLEEVAGAPIGERAAALVDGRIVARARRSQSGLVEVNLPMLVVATALAAAAVARGGSLGAGLALGVADITSSGGEDDPAVGERDETPGQRLAEVVPMRTPMRVATPGYAHDDAHDLAA